ncbi:MAG: hypothetical protein CL908_10555 [Deltaproteobacteria bacterium]|nr:hypothetical protein [Deltaproteobacteria bacterium]
MATAVRETAARAGSAATRVKILQAAELLFAKEGFDRVTLRQIARASGQRNVAAVQYHFGSKERLLTAIVDKHRAELDERRRLLIDDCDGNNDGEDLRSLLTILVQPLVLKLDSPSGRAYLRIQAQGFSNETMRPATRRVVQRIGQSLSAAKSAPGDPYRSHFAILLLFHGLADRARQEEKGAAARRNRAAFARALEEALLGLLRGGGNV